MPVFLVIGSNSFSGASFVGYLLSLGYKVLGVSRSKQPNNVFLPYQWIEENKNFNFKQIDLNQDLEKLIKWLYKEEPKYIVNFAAQGMVAQSWDTPEDWYQTNILAQVKLHDRLRKLDFLDKYIHVTTPEVYGSTEGWIKENFHFSPSTPYAVSRAACDMHLKSFFNAYNFPVVFTRAANVYGPGQQLYRIVPRAILFSLLGKKLQLHGGGVSVRSFIHINDVADATLKIALEGKLGETYHISTKSTVSIRSLVEKICDLTQVSFENLVVDSEERLGKDQSYLLESDKIRKELNWKDNTDLEKGLVSTVSWVQDNLTTLKSLPFDYQHKS